MNALKSAWFWLALVALVVAAAFLWRRQSAVITSNKLTPKSATPPVSSQPSTLESIAKLATVASSIFDTVYSAQHNGDDED